MKVNLPVFQGFLDDSRKRIGNAEVDFEENTITADISNSQDFKDLIKVCLKGAIPISMHIDFIFKKIESE